MSTRLPRKNGSFRIIGKGRQQKTKRVRELTYRGYKIRYEFYDIPEVYLISIYHISPKNDQPLFEFLVEQQVLQDQRVKKYLVAFIDELVLHIEKNEIKIEISNLYGCDYNSITSEQRQAYLKAKEIVKFYFSKNS